ncbi:MAG: hypothetical protein IPL46_26315 [Saprospiraceae bacterium]|nr:hypothetical protein [Saprospiraceae bacterium]
MSAKPIAIVSRQAGTANALKPVISHLLDEGYHLTLLAYSKSALCWQESRFSFIEIDSFKKAKKYLDESEPSLLLTGTSLEVEDDAAFWQWASSSQIPSIAFVDSWVNYWQRFTIGDRHFNYLPDHIAVTDTLMKQRMIESGCPEGIIRITGNPLFDHLTNTRKIWEADKPDVDRLQVIFISEGWFDYYQENVGEQVGYTEFTVLTSLLEYLSDYQRKQGEPIDIRIKLHPREESGKYRHLIEQYQRSGLDIIELAGSSSYDSLLSSHLVVGMQSILLYENALMGKQSVSLQPNRIVSRNDITDDREGINVFTSFDEAIPYVDAVLKNKRLFERSVSTNLNATSKMLELISRCLPH